jgi:pilus assembly protein CpaE
MLKLMLTRLSHAPTVTLRGDEGLDLLTNNQYDLVILDLMMPGLDGYEVLRRARADKRLRTLPMLVLTARSQPADREAALEAGADAYMTKPVEPREFSNKLSEMLAAPRTERPAPATSQIPGTVHLTTGPGVTTDSSMLTARTAGFEPLVFPTPNGPPPTGRLITVFGLRGGVGRTTFAVNLAGVLARTGRRVCLVDVAPNVGQVTLHLRVRTRMTWFEMPDEIDSSAIAQLIVRHDSGVFVVGAPQKPVLMGLPGQLCFNLLYQLRNTFNDVIVDGAAVLDDAMRTALAASRYACLVLSPEVGAVHSAQSVLRAFSNLAPPETLLKVIVNQTTPEALVPTAGIERALNRAVNAILPYEKGQAAALAQGIPLVLSQSGAPLVEAVGKFSATL